MEQRRKLFVLEWRTRRIFVWSVQIKEPSAQILEVYAIPVGILPPSSDEADLRIMDFAVVPISERGSTHTGVKYELVVTVYSDSALRFWIHDRQAPPAEHAGNATGDGAEATENNRRRLKLIGSGQYRTCCLLNCDILVSNDTCLLLVTSTDGHVVGWNITQEILAYGGVEADNDSLYLVDEARGLKELESDVSAKFSLGQFDFRLQTHQSSVKDSLYLASHTPVPKPSHTIMLVAVTTTRWFFHQSYLLKTAECQAKK